MGYTTDFTGSFLLDKPLSTEHYTYLKEFSNTRRVKRDAEKTKLCPDPIRQGVDLPLGEEGCYFVGDAHAGRLGGGGAEDILDINRPPAGQPGIWCEWAPNEDGTTIEWNGDSSFSNYVEWITYLIEHFLAPWGYVLNGIVEWQGEESEDVGVIYIDNNRVLSGAGK